MTAATRHHHKTSGQSSRRTGHINPPLLLWAMCVPRLPDGAFLSPRPFEPRRLSLSHPHPHSFHCALDGDDHFIVVPCLAHADTLASSFHHSIPLHTIPEPTWKPTISSQTAR